MRRMISVLCATGALVIALGTSAYYLGQERVPALAGWSLFVRGLDQEIRALRANVRYDLRFTDVSDRIATDFKEQTAYPEQDTWYDHGNAICAADVDRDGFTDVYVTSQIGANALLMNVGGGFEDRTHESGVGLDDHVSTGCSFGDYNNDGFADLYVTSIRSGNVLFENTGGTFKDVTPRAKVGYVGHSSASVFFDHDNDGLLDIFVVNFGRFTSDTRSPQGFEPQEHMMVGDVTKTGERSILYRNRGDGTFEDVTERAGLDALGWSGDATFLDVQQDGAPDLYVLNMHGPDRFYSNQNGRFSDETSWYFPRSPHGSMGIKYFDVDGDGALDLFVTDMHSDMPYDQRYDEESRKTDRARALYSGHGPRNRNTILGNALFVRRGPSFEEISDAVGAETYWPWGISVGDVNADGHQDAFITSGMGKGTWWRYGVDALLLNDGISFTRAEFVTEIEPREHLYLARTDAECEKRREEGFVWCVPMESAASYSSALFDIENDGDLDIFVNEMRARPRLLLNDLSEKGIRHLAIRLEGTRSNRDGLGATVTVHAAGRTYVQYNDGKSGYLAQSSLPLYFGLGDADTVEAIEIRWPSGVYQQIEGPIGTNQTLVIKEEW